MKALAVAFVLALPAHAVDVDKDGRLVLTPAEKASCAAEGGCVLMTRRLVQQIIEMVERTKLECTRDTKGPI
jgi:hypothetical protein